MTTENVTWTNDPNHSQLRFAIKHMGIAYIEGYFTDFHVEVKATDLKAENTSVTFEAKSASIHTGIKARDEHLKSPDFLDTANHPLLTFKSTSLRWMGDQFAKLYGYLSLHGKTQLVELDAIFYGSFEDQENRNKFAGFKISGAIKRSDFELGANFPEAVVSDLVNIDANIEFITPL